jgi:nitrogen regulatory protein P-II 1
MYYLVVLIVNDPDDCQAILDAWEETGVEGITILNSSGIGHLRQAGLREDLPLMPSLVDLLESEEIFHRLLFSVVPNQEMVDRLVAATLPITGDLDRPHSGFLFVLPVAQVYGLNRRDA